MFGKVQLTSFVFTALALSTSGAVARPHRARVGDYDPTVQQRDLSDEEVLELFARSGAAAKIGKDLIGFAPNAISSADKKLKAAHSTDARNKMGPSPFSKAAKPVGFAGHSSSSKKKRELEDELMEILARSGAAAKIGKDLIGFAPNAISSADKQLKAAHSTDARNKHGPSPFSKAAKPVGYAGHSSSSKKKRDLEDALEELLARSSAEDELEELLARSGAAGKIGKDVIGFAPNVISTVDKHLKAAHSTEARNKMGPSPFSKAAKPVGYAGHSSSSKKKRELEDELEELLARSGAAGKIGKDVIGFAPNVISTVDKHLKAAHSTEARNKMGPSPFSKAAKPVGYAGHSSSSKKKRELEDELVELLARSGAAAKIGKDLIGFAPNAISSADKKLKAAHSTEARNKMGPSPFSKAAKPVGYAGHSSSSKKKRDFEDELMEIFARSGAAGKIGKDVIGFAPNVISTVDKHLKAAHSTEARNKMGPSPFSKAAKPVGYAGHSSSSKKKRDLVDALGDYLEARSLEIDELEARSFEYDELDELE